LNGIHGLNGGFNHSKSGNPQRISVSGVIKESSPAISQEIIFSSGLARGIGIEDVWLRRNVAQVCGDDLGILAKLLDISVSIGAPSRGGSLQIGASINVEFGG